MKKNDVWYRTHHKTFCPRKTLRIMKLTTLLLIFTCLQVLASETYSQVTKLSMDLGEVTVENALQEIENNSEFFFLLNQDLVDVNRRVTANFQDQQINEILASLFRGTDVDFHVMDRQIILSPKRYLEEVKAVFQAKTVAGTVVDENGTPLPGTEVIVKGTTTGTITDVDGNYSIQVEDPSAVLVFSFVGYVSQEVPVGDQTRINVTMSPDIIGIEEVVMIGYGTQRKVTVTGSVVSTGGEDIVKSQTPDVVNSLVGRLPGVIINSRTGEPGREDPSVYIRGLGTTGDTDPLVVIDGVPREGLGQLNPNDIEQISVLKDASAAIYGARAANGVILVNTKRGKTGTPTFDFTYNQGFSQPTRNPIMADAYTWATVYNEIETTEGRDPYYSAEEIGLFREGNEFGYQTTDWYDVMTRTTPQHRLNLSVSGGSDVLNYYLSVGEMSQQGHFNYGDRNVQRYNLRSNVSARVADFLTVNFDLAGRLNDNRYAGNPDTRGIYSHIYLYHPNWTLFWPGTDYKRPLRDNQNIINWVSDDAGYQDQKFRGLQSNLNFDIDIPWIEGLGAKAGIYYDLGYNFIKTWDLPTYVYYDNGDGTYSEGLSGEGAALADLAQEFNQNNRLTINTQLIYERSFGNHHIGAMAGYEQMEYRYNFMSAARSDYISTALPQLFAGSSEKEKQSNDGSASSTARVNFFGRVTYDYARKYMAQAIFRYDGSPNFPEDKRWGFFPGISLGWRISEEDFMSNLNFVDNLKIRGSYGEMGNDAVDPYQYLTAYEYGNNYVLGGSDVVGLIQAGVPNPNITWEVAKTTNIGFDATLWQGLLGMEFDYFKSERSNILTKRTVVIPDYTGLALPDENIGIVENNGFELQMSHRKSIGNLRYSLHGNVSFARNTVIFADEAPAAEEYQRATGHPIGSALYYQAVGIYSDQEDVETHATLAGARPGDIKFEDVNEDGVINSFDRVRMDLTETPEIVFGFGGSLEYAGFDMTVLFQGQENAQVYLGGYFPIMSYSLGNFTQWRAEDHWSPDNTDATQPRGSVETRNNNSQMESTHWIMDAGFLRLKNLEIGYNLPSSFSNRIGIQNLRLYVSGYNLLILYDQMKELGFDPETNDYWFYPQQRVFNLGVNLTF